MFDFIRLDIDLSLQTSDSKWLDPTKWWLDSKKFLVTLTRKACDSDSTNMTRAEHWYNHLRRSMHL